MRYSLFLAAVLTLLPLGQVASAAGFSAQYEKKTMKVDLAGVDYRMKFPMLSLGFLIQPGIYLELSISDDSASDQQSFYDLTLGKRESLALRFQSPEDVSMGLKAYFEFGWAHIELQGQGALTGKRKSDIDAGLLGFGMSKPFGRNRRHHWFMEMERLDNGSDFESTDWSYGYRYEIGQ